MRNARIIATEMYAPQNVVTNAWFNEQLGEDVGTWLEENLTIRERRWCGPDESTADLVTACAEPMLAKANLQAADLDLVIVATDTPEYISPSTAAIVQHRLGASGAGTFDVNTACAGFVTALDMGAKYIRSDERYTNVMVIGAYAMSKYLDRDDKKTVTLFADGAAGVILQADTEGAGWQAAQLHTEGQYADWMGIYAGGTAQPITPEVVAAGSHKLRFVRKFPKEINPTTWTRMIEETVAAAGFTVPDIDRVFFTQININSIRETLGNLGLTEAKTHCVMDRYAYTGSACIPMCLAEADAQGQLKKGDLVVFMGSGGGLAFACAAFTW
ncbi:MAG: ketoacyl-ACP synthase III [Candidatus Krumholzibacteria bacterium]|nr:ketoacyl-ACP synthase III [Candidatus Krumholzibacteria bacterium]